MNTNTVEQVLLDALVSAKEVGSEVLSMGKVGAIKAYEFAQEQIPDILREIIVYNRIENTALFLLFCGLTAVCGYIIRSMINSINSNNGALDDSDMPLIIIPGLVGGLLFCVTVFAFSSMMKVWFAPKLFLIEYIASLAKTVN